MWVNVYHSETGKQGSFTLARVQEAHLISQERGAQAPAVAWVPGLGKLSLRRPIQLGYGWWVMVTEREPRPLGELRVAAQESILETK